MRVDQLEIYGFRQLHGSYQFSPGLNVLVGENEAGKSALQWALIRLFYGFQQGARLKPSEGKERDAEKPWNGRAFGLSARLTSAKDQQFELTWDFDQGALTLVDAVSGKDLSDAVRGKGESSLVGQRLLGVTYREFVAMACSLQGQAANLGVSNSVELAERLRNYVDTGSQESGVDQAVETLQRFRTEQIGLRRGAQALLQGRPLAELTAQLESVKERRLQALQLRKEATELTALTEQLSSDLRQSKEQEKSLQTAFSAKEAKQLEEAYEQAQRLTAEASEIKVVKRPFYVLVAFLLTSISIAGYLVGANIATSAVLFVVGLAVVGFGLLTEQQKSQRLEAINSALETHLDGRSLKELESSCGALKGRWQGEVAAAYRDLSKDDLRDELFKQQQRSSQIDVELAKAATRLESLESETLLTAELDEQRAVLEEKITQAAVAAEAVELATETLNEVVSARHREVMPQIESVVTPYIDQITAGRYTKATVGSDLSLTLTDPSSGRQVLSDRLSAGTQDQLGFALKLALVELLDSSGRTVPLLLDDPFTNYDSNRRELVLKLLSDQAVKRQVFVSLTERSVAKQVCSEVEGAALVDIESSSIFS